METIKNRAELLFLYDVKDNNPNGDPLDGNKPRIDEETGINIVTDVRLKRTIRDYLKDFKGKEIFVREIVYDEEGHIQDAKLRAKDFIKIDEENESTKDVLEKYVNGNKIEKKDIPILVNSIRENVRKTIDVRLFGATIPLEFTNKEVNNVTKEKPIKTSVIFTGPVQFRMGRSMHKVELKYIKGTGAFASKAGATQKTFREEYILPYSLIAFYGIVNENAAKETNLTDNDLKLLLEAMWNGTKNLISRSKAGHEPRILLKVTYKGNNYHVGDLDKLIALETEKRDEEIRDIAEVKLNADKLIEQLEKVSDSVEKIEYKVSDRVNTDLIGKLEEKFVGKVSEIEW